MKYLLFIVILVFLSVRADAQCRSRQSYYYPNHVVQEQIVEQQVYYFVGQPLRIESLMRLEKENTCHGTDSSGLAEEFRQFQEFRQFKQAQRATGNRNADCDTCNKETADVSTGTDSNTNNARIRSSLLEQKCGKCHSGVSPKGQLSLEKDSLLNAQQFKKSRDMINSGKMPKGGPPLSDTEKDQIIAELSLRLN